MKHYEVADVKPTLGNSPQTPRVVVPERVDSAAPAPEAVVALPVQYTQTRVVHVPPLLLRKHRILMPNQADPVASAYKILRTRVLQRMRAHDWTTLAVTSPRPGEGKTLTAINLAISLAREVSLTVLLVDMDLRRPGVHRYFGYDPLAGVSDHLLHGRPLTDILFNPGLERLVVLPGRESIHNSSEMLNAPATAALLHELKTRYARRFIIFDLPPLLDTDDVLAFAPQVDATLFVVAEGKTSRDDLRHASQAMQGMNILGTVVNRARVTVPGYY